LHHGNITAENAISDIVAYTQTGNLGNPQPKSVLSQPHSRSPNPRSHALQTSNRKIFFSETFNSCRYLRLDPERLTRFKRAGGWRRRQLLRFRARIRAHRHDKAVRHSCTGYVNLTVTIYRSFICFSLISASNKFVEHPQPSSKASHLHHLYVPCPFELFCHTTSAPILQNFAIEGNTIEDIEDIFDCWASFTRQRAEHDVGDERTMGGGKNGVEILQGRMNMAVLHQQNQFSIHLCVSRLGLKAFSVICRGVQ
jgi:hypothetical protein